MFRAILEHVQSRIAVGREPNFVFLTGDVANAGKPTEYEMFGEEFLLPLFELLGPAHDRRLYCVPGNHDVDRAKAPFVSREVVIRRAPNFLDPTAEGLSHRKHVLPRFEAFINGDLTVDAGHWLASEAGIFTDFRKVGELGVGIVGVNSAWHSQDDDDFGNLAPGADLLESALHKLESANVVLVLGHHPLEWLAPTDAHSMRTVLARHKAIYLHGHYHRTETRLEYATGHLFRTFQAGACFQARDDEKWQNRLLWCELDWPGQVIMAEPFAWVELDREWRVDGRAFPELNRLPDQARWAFPLPGVSDVDSPRLKSRPVLDAGWEVVDRRGLLDRARPVSDEEIIKFFDGRVPDWPLALSARVPRRTIVAETVQRLRHAPTTKGPTLCALLGAGGEGKTTATIQVAAALLQEDIVDVLLCRTSSSARLDPSLLHRIGKQRIAVVADDAHNLVPVVREAWSVPRTVHDGVIYLFCSRDTDWIASGGANVDWPTICSLHKVKLRGLSKQDAEMVVAAWREFGDRGLGNLQGLPPHIALEKLLQQAREEAHFEEGAFLGALLRTRIGQGLREHVRLLLERFEHRTGAKHRRLIDAFAYICAVHSEGLDILTDEILAWTLGVSVADLRRNVIVPLGDEAAATAHGNLVVSRHREIAREAVAILTEEKGYSLADLFQDLLLAADRAANEGCFVIKLREWRYGLCDHFLSAHRYDMAQRLAAGLVNQNPNNPFFATKFAQTLRLAGQAADAEETMAEALLRVTLARDGTRTFYYEWAKDCLQAGHPALAAWLAGVGLADLEGVPLVSENFRGAMNTLEAAATKLGEAAAIATPDGIESFVRRAWQVRERDLPSPVPIPADLRFDLFRSWWTKDQ